jgi:hypothetical protein
MDTTMSVYLVISSSTLSWSCAYFDTIHGDKAYDYQIGMGTDTVAELGSCKSGTGLSTGTEVGPGQQGPWPGEREKFFLSSPKKVAWGTAQASLS